MLKEALADLLNESEISLLTSSFDIIGDIAIIKIPLELHSKERIIAKEILQRMKNVRTVLKQSSDVQGEFRIRELAFVGGEEKFETIYKESNCLFKIDLRKVFFSPRLSTERERISRLVKDGEHVFNMFAGIGTFSIIIAKRKVCEIESVDINPSAIELAHESLKLNKKLRGKVNPILSDAGEFAFSHKGEFDRILMPLPERSKEFLPSAFFAAKKDAIVHYYVHVPTENFQNKDWILDHLKSLSLNKNFEVQNWKRVREVGPRYIQAVADIKVAS